MDELILNKQMSFSQFIKHLFFSMSRIGRLEHFGLYLLFLSLIFSTVLFGNVNNDAFFAFIFIPSILIVTVYLLLIKVRRLHDFEYSAWWILLFLIPVIGEIWFIIVFFIPGTKTKNKYGDIPLKLKGLHYAIIFMPSVLIIGCLLLKNL